MKRLRPDRRQRQPDLRALFQGRTIKREDRALSLGNDPGRRYAGLIIRP